MHYGPSEHVRGARARAVKRRECVKYWNSDESLSDSAAFVVLTINRRNRYILPLKVPRQPPTGPRPRVQVLLSHVSAEHADESILTTYVVAVQSP